MNTTGAKRTGAKSTWAAILLAAAVSCPPHPAAGQARESRAAAAPATQPAGGQAEVPVKQVVLFSSGVGYFEHYGSVKGDGTAELRFKTDQINDVLKSLVLQDLDKGQVGTVSYPSQEPLAKTLRSFQVDITNNPPLADLLNELRGAKVTLTLASTGAAGEQVNGTVVGVEKKRKVIEAGGAAGKGEVIESWLLNLKTGHKFRAVPLDDLRDFQLDDPKLEEEMDKALAALAQARDQDKKPVTINFRGQGERRVRIGYVVETPVWKTSYRLVLAGEGDLRHGREGDAEAHAAPKTQPADKAGDAAGKGVGKLQGWAIVENQTDNDWTDVQLSLVSGRPISYIQDLYHPLFVPRPVVFPDLYMSLRPQTYQGGISDDEQNKMNQQRQAANGAPTMDLAPAAGSGGGRTQHGGGGAGGSGLFGGSGATNGRNDQAAQNQPMDPTASVISAASASQLGELFEYTVGNVSLARQKSAMIPIVTDDVEVEKLSIYNQSVLETHPLNGARVKNTTKKHLLQGPVTVLEAGGYAGDARIDDLPPGQQRLLSYGIDLNVTVDATDQKADSTIQTGKIVKGVLEVTRKEVNEQTYVMQNKADAAKAVVVEHPRQADWKLVAPASAEETTDSLYRFKSRVDAHKTTKLLVKTETVQSQEVQILNTDVSSLQEFIKIGEIPQKVRDALGQVVKLKSAMVDTEREIQSRQQHIQEISTEQARLRENMKTVAQNSDYYNRLLKKLDDQETNIEKLQKENADLTKILEKQKAELEAFIAGLEVG